MKCDEVQPLHGPYLDSELDAKTTVEIQQHLATCAECARMFATGAKLDARIMTGLKRGQRTAALWEQVEQRVVAAARSAPRPQSSPHNEQASWLAKFKSQLANLLWPRPLAWAGLAAVWAVILAINFATSAGAPKIEARRATPPSGEQWELLRQQRQMLAELGGAFEKPGGGSSRPVGPQPRSQRREEILNT